MSSTDRAQQLLDYYYEKRVKNQREYYDGVAQKYKGRDSLLRVSAGILMLGTALVSLLASLFQTQSETGMDIVWGILVVVLPALSTALLTLRNVFGYEWSQSLYSQVCIQLGDLIQVMPSPTEPNLSAQLKDYIKGVEACLSRENVEWLGEWGKVRAIEPTGAQPPASEA